MDESSLAEVIEKWLDARERRVVVAGRVLAAPRLIVGSERLVFDPPHRDASLTRLRALAEPAVFGQGAETRRDATVRSGLQLLAPHVEVEGLSLAPVLARLGEELCSVAPRAELHGVQIYGPGDHFVAHRDTPRGVDHLGTLVVGLPVEHAGGALVVGEERLEGWGDASRTLPWAAFFADVPHSVEPVVSGTRVTLSFDLYVPSGATPVRPAEEALAAERRAALARPDVATRACTLAVPCAHLYGMERTRERPRRVTATELGRLKGRDVALAAAALSLGLDVTLAPVLAVDDGSEDLGLAGVLARTLGPTDIARLSGADVGASALAAWTEERPGLFVVHPREVATRELFRCQFSANDYFGNEGTEAFVYVLAALLVEIPGADERLVRGRRVRHPKLGVGAVQARQVSEGATFFVVRFDDGAVRTILADKLELLEE